ncbi:hypothetical protein [Anaerovibrio sp.]|uniref:hypothetical protein n=1 Tax=Anaerovibrio sp. TaxID=1872532 RepID=UPI00388CEDFD
MNKITNPIVILIIIYILCMSTTVSALSKNQIALGGIPLDASLKYVNSIYGPPTHIDGGGRWVSHYGNGFLVYSSSRRSRPDNHYEVGVNYVDQVIVTQNNGIATPDGAYVGMRENSIEELYGTPFNKFVNEKGELTYWYFANTQLLELKVKNSKVISIRITETD